MLSYLHIPLYTKLIIDYLLSHNKSIPRRPDSKLHSSQDDHPITKLLSTTNGDYKFGMEVPDAMISNAIKKKVGYKYYVAKKVEREKVKIVDEPEEQHVSPIKSERGKCFMCYGGQVANVPNKLKKDVVPRKTGSFTIVKEAVVGQGSSATQNKYYDSSNTTSDATLYSSSLEKSKESGNETDDAAKSDMDLSDDNPHGDDDAQSKENSLSYNNSLTKLTTSQRKEADAKGEKEYEEDRLQEGSQWFPKKSRLAKRITTWFDLFLKSDIDKDENHILGPSTVAIANIKEKYTTSITKHYAVRYYKEGIEDRIPKRWSKEVRRYHFEALNGIRHWEEDKIDFFKAGMSAVTKGNVYSDLRIKSVVHILVKKKWGYGFLP
ncbi:hypothetical protein Tco_0610939 [Tanacetum coccineum]